MEAEKMVERKQHGRVENVSNKEISIENEAPDGGWGWVVVLGSAIAFMLIGGLDRISGILFLILQEKFGRSASVTAWIFSIGDTVALVSSPIASAICNRFSCRVTVISGTFVILAGFVLTSLVPKFEVIFFSLGLVAGFGRSLAQTPSILIVGLYFNNKRSLATGIAMAGGGIGGMFMPPMIDVLHREFGFAGTMLITGGIMLNIAIAGALYRPLEVNKRITSLTRNRRMQSKSTSNADELLHLNQDEDQSTQTDILNGKRINNYTTKIFENITSDEDAPGVSVAPLENGDHVTRENIKESVDAHVKTLSKQITAHGKTSEIKSHSKKTLFEFSLLRNPSFLLMCFSSLVFTLGLKSSLVFIPALAKQHGISTIDAALILSIFGGMEFIGRLTSGVLDHKRIRKYRLFVFNVLMVISSLLTVLLGVATGFSGFSVLSAVLGICIGIYQSQTAVIVVDLLGAEKLMTSYGLTNAFRGLGMLIGLPIAGLFRDTLGSFKYAYYFSGALIFLASLLMLACNAIHVRQKKESIMSEVNGITITGVTSKM